MYAVGADRLSEHWRKHPEAEGELRALHALLTATDPEMLRERLGATASFDASGADIALAASKVRIEINAAAGVALYAGVMPAGKEGL
jgi:hypothetical protein